MTTRSASHASFTITRRWKASPARVFQAFADAEQKYKWFARSDDLTRVDRRMDFRENGREMVEGQWKSGMVSRFDCLYQDIVANERILYSYVMHLDGRKISVSQACIELTADGSGTTFVLTEYGDYLDGYDDAGRREHGTNALIDALAASLGE